jgi:uncharacterized membrane protein YdbT with pleckstrin-like domain
MSNEMVIKPDRKLLYKWYFQYIFSWFIILLFTFIICTPLLLFTDFFLLTAFFIGTELILAILVVIILWPFLKMYFSTFEYRLTPDHIEVRKGLINKNLKYVPYRTVTNINTTYGFFDRRFSIGSLHIETAGASYPKLSPEERLDGLLDAKSIQKLVLNRLHKFKTPYTTASEISLDSSNELTCKFNKISEDLTIIRKLLQNNFQK